MYAHEVILVLFVGLVLLVIAGIYTILNIVYKRVFHIHDCVKDKTDECEHNFSAWSASANDSEASRWCKKCGETEKKPNDWGEFR